MNNAELIKALRNCSSPRVGSCMDCPYYKGVSCKWQMMEDAAAALKAADKRIAELEAQMPKEGEWIEQDDGDSIFFKCSVCGKIQYNVLLEMMQGEYHYCPNCGARMQTVTDCHALEEGKR